MRDYADVAAHPRMHAAGHREQDFLKIETLELLLRSRRLRFVPARVDCGFRMNVMIQRVAVFNFYVLACHHAKYMRTVDAAILIELDGLGRGSPARFRKTPRNTVADPHESISQGSIRVDDHHLGFRRRMMLPLAHRVRGHIDVGHRGGSAAEQYSTGDGACGGRVHARGRNLPRMRTVRKAQQWDEEENLHVRSSAAQGRA